MDASPVPSPRRARVRVGAGAALILVLLGLGVAVLVTAVTPHGGTSVVAPGPGSDGVAASQGGGADAAGADAGSSTGADPDADPGEASGAALIYVHILGQVVRPGLYELRDGARAVDIVAAAGGFTDQADPAGLNLARFLSDGEQIVVPAVGEIPAGGAGSGGGVGVAADGTVNLNTADAAALDTLPRIGPAMAERIIAWREANGRFTAVEDLLDVAGIGDATLSGLRDLVTV